jgi:hypothetical protein
MKNYSVPMIWISRSLNRFEFLNEFWEGGEFPPMTLLNVCIYLHSEIIDIDSRN